MKKEKTLFEKVRDIHGVIATDAMGGSPLDKCFIMAYLAQRYALKNYVEIGVYRGKSLLSVAPAFQENRGICIGIDPWCSESFREQDTTDDIRILVDRFADTVDFNGLYQDVLQKKIELQLADTITLIRETSEEAYPLLLKRFDMVSTDGENREKENTFIDMLHIDGNHDYVYVSQDAERYIPLVNQGGFVVFDDIDWDGVRKVYEQYKEELILIYETEEFGILLKSDELKDLARCEGYCPTRFAPYAILRTILPSIMDNVRKLQEVPPEEKVRVFAAVMTYNQEKYIEEAIASLLAQTGDNLELFIGVFDDCSSDSTVSRAASFRNLPAHIHLQVYPNEKNGGFEKNYIRIFNAFRESDCDYLTILDGDDYLATPDRMDIHVKELARHPECAVSFNNLMYFYEDTKRFELWDKQNGLNKHVYTAFDLMEEYFIGNGSCSLVRKNAVMDILDSYYLEAKIGDWLSHCLYATRGDILHISAAMNVYRKHDKGIWSGITTQRQSSLLRAMLQRFHILSKYLFYGHAYNCTVALNREILKGNEMNDLLIMDDIFPHPVSGFRMEEYSAYLNHFQNLQILCNGGSSCALGKTPHSEIMGDFLARYPQWHDKLLEDKHVYYYPFAKDFRIKSKLAYFCFLGNAYVNLDLMEDSQVPFVFELYPGGSFALNTQKSDAMLLRVLRSPCFRKVIVTQDITRDYLLKNHFCRPDQIEEIFGVVTPEKLLKTQPTINREGPLRICFAAMRYTKDGRDKGYDVFIETLRILNGKGLDIEFHVAGGFDEDVIPLEELEGKVTFHGILNNQALAEFLRKMDIIISPNINNAITKGAFDGFPTGTCTEAGLNGVLMMCTDPLSLNNGRFINQQEIEIISRDAEEIAERVEYYCNNREALVSIIEKQYQKIQEYYGVDAQVGRRIRLLESEISRYEENLSVIQRELQSQKIQCRLFYSDNLEYFEQEDYVAFDICVSNGAAHGDIAIESLRGHKYFWCYFITDHAWLMRRCQFIVGDKVIEPSFASDETTEGYCVFDGANSFVAFEEYFNEDMNERLMRFEAELDNIEDNPAVIQGEWQNQKIQCRLFYSDNLEYFEQEDYVAFDICVSNGAAHGDIAIESLRGHKYFWCYFITDHAWLMRRCQFIVGDKVIEPSFASDETTEGYCVFDGANSFVAFQEYVDTDINERCMRFAAEIENVVEEKIMYWKDQITQYAATCQKNGN